MAEALRRLYVKGKYNKLMDFINPTFLMTCYESIRSKPGNMRRGVDKGTLDGIDEAWFHRLSASIKKGSFRFRAVRLKEEPKPKGGDRPLGKGYPREKIVQKALQRILSTIYEPQFISSNTGFRPNKGTHTALRYLYMHVRDHTWVINGDIKKCFDAIPHDRIIELLRKRIGDEDFISLVVNHLKAGEVLPNGDIRKDKLGVPKGSVVSPVIANIVLHEFDLFMEKLKERFKTGRKRRRENEEYKKTHKKVERCRKRIRETILAYGRKREEVRRLQIKRNCLIKQLRKTRAVEEIDPDFKRIGYVRYADDFVILVRGSHREAQRIRDLISNELKKRCGLELNKERTTIKRTTSWNSFLGATFRKLGYFERSCTRHRGDTARARETMVNAPKNKIKEKLMKLGVVKDTKFSPTSLGYLITMDHRKIIQFYNARIAGIVNYYSFAGNRSSLLNIVYLLYRSCALTLARKYKHRSMRAVIRRFGPELKCPRTGKGIIKYKSLKAIHLYKNNLDITHETLEDLLERRWIPGGDI